MRKSSKQRDKGNRIEKRLSEKTAFPIVEAYKNIRTGLFFSLATSKQKAIVFSSAEPNTGKSTTCSNLAIAMAQTGARVLLLDADLRRPVQSKIFGVQNITGLSELLGGLANINEVIIPNVFPKLDLIPSGPIPPNPSELLGSENTEKLLHSLAEHYDYIFIDTPPVNVVSDALLFSQKTAGMVLVARQKQTLYRELERAIENIRNVDSNILGVVLTDVKEAEKPYGYSYRYKNYEDYT